MMLDENGACFRDQCETWTENENNAGKLLASKGLIWVKQVYIQVFV